MAKLDKASDYESEDCRFESYRARHIIMKLTEDGGLLSDSGHTFLLRVKDGRVACAQHSIALNWLTEEDKDMSNKPEEIWEKFFRQPTQDVI